MITLNYSDILLDESIRMVEETVIGNGVICYPTDTLYGLGGCFFSPQLIKKIDTLKNRGDLPYSVVVSGMPMLERLVAGIPEPFSRIYPFLVPGKFTFLFTASPDIPTPLLKNSRKIGIRIPGLTGLLKLVKHLEIPLVSTSVNRTGQPPLNDPESIGKRFPGIDLLISRGPLPASQGSTILDVTEKPIACIRKGDDYHRLRETGIEVTDRF